jgi:hypothetical protein
MLLGCAYRQHDQRIGRRAQLFSIHLGKSTHENPHYTGRYSSQ